MCCKKVTTWEGKEKRLDKTSTMVSTIKVSAYVCLKYEELVGTTVGCLRNNNSKPIHIYDDQDGHNLVESPWKSFVFWKNNNKLRGLQEQSVHTIKR